MNFQTKGFTILYSINAIKIPTLHHEQVKVLNYLIVDHIFKSSNIKQNRPLQKQFYF